MTFFSFYLIEIISFRGGFGVVEWEWLLHSFINRQSLFLMVYCRYFITLVVVLLVGWILFVAVFEIIESLLLQLRAVFS